LDITIKTKMPFSVRDQTPDFELLTTIYRANLADIKKKVIPLQKMELKSEFKT
jgi:hypothetical protein